MSGTHERQVINVGLIGCGCIAENHAFSISLVENNARKIWKDASKKVRVKLYAMADTDPAALDRLASAFAVPKRYGGPRAGYDLIDDPDVHAIYVLVPTADHLDYVLKAAAKKKHVFCEKPLAFSPGDVRKMIAARDDNHIVVQAGLVFRSAPQIIYLKKLLAENKAKWGRISNVVFRDSQEKPYKGKEEVHGSTWRGDVSKAHAGILFEHTIHDIDGLIFAFGEVDEVYGKVTYMDRPGIETGVSAIITFKNGLNLSVNSMWNDIDFSERRMEFYFENAWVHVTVDERAGADKKRKLVTIKTRCLKEPEQELDDAVMDAYFRYSIGMSHVSAELAGPYYYEDLRFFDAIVKGQPSPVKLEYGLYAQRVIEAVYESSRTGRAVKIDEFDP
ncbi:MAG: Gfo/Idh/MocA family protein [Candidatus Sigynarchaeota archaeon]